jgi:hypothetical protein
MANKDSYTQALSELLTYDVGRNAYFDVTFPKLPTIVKLPAIVPYKGKTSQLSYLCHSAELPGEYTTTVDQKIYGVVERFPIMTTYKDITLSFYTRGSDVDYVRMLFSHWITASTGRNVDNASIRTYNVPYKADITTDLTINQYSVDGSRLLRCELIEAFPISIMEVPLSWSLANEAMSLNITFTYTEYQYID